MRSWTIDEMLAERPCEEYTRERITELWAGRERLTLLEVLDLPILAKDIVWVICRRNALTPEQQAEWLERIVTRAIRNHALNCGIPTVERWAQNWLDGTDRSRTAEATWAAAVEAAAEAARAAGDAARAAAWAAEEAEWAAEEAAEEAEEAAEEAASRAAARAAAWAAAEAAARAAAWAAAEAEWAAEEAAWSAAWAAAAAAAAAREAAWSAEAARAAWAEEAAWSAAADAECERQVADAMAVMEETTTTEE